jgi:hypothetical protein
MSRFDSLEKYRADAEKQEREFAAARARREREQQREQRRTTEIAAANEAGRLRLEFEHRLAAPERGHRDLCENVVEITRAVSETFDTLADQRMDLSQATREELRDLKIEVSKLSSLTTELRKTEGGFQFAREKTGGIEDLPNPLAARKELN